MAEEYLGDLAKTQKIFNLIKVSQECRDAAWIRSFFDNVGDASFSSTNPQVLRGPDGFPYFILNLPKAGEAFQCYVLRHMVGDFLLSNGLGVVIEPGQGRPQWVFSYGDLLGFSLKGNFEPFDDASELKPGHSSEVLAAAEEVLVGQPSESYLPSTARQVLRRFLVAQGVADPNIVLMTRKKAGGVISELVFDIDAEKVGNADLASRLLPCIRWFLPRGYGFCSVSHETFVSNFEPL